MRGLVFSTVLLLVLMAALPAAHARGNDTPVCGTTLDVTGDPAPLEAFARREGLAYPEAFAHLMLWLAAAPGRDTLPPCYVTKNDARRAGWHPGANVWATVGPGTALGGSHFGNREKRLPRSTPSGQPPRYVEADLDYDGGRRGAHRLVFDRTMGDHHWRVWVTTDHYRSFQRVPEPDDD